MGYQYIVKSKYQLLNHIRQRRLDGLNKHLDKWDSYFYMGEFRTLCAKENMHELKWPAREYVVQIARFDPAKGIPNVIDSYAKFRKMLVADDADYGEDDMPQLLICGHGAGTPLPQWLVKRYATNELMFIS